MNRCRTCKWWEEGRRFPGMIVPAFCHRFDDLSEDNLMLPEDEEIAFVADPGPDFGCIHHEPIEVAPQKKRPQVFVRVNADGTVNHEGRKLTLEEAYALAGKMYPDRDVVLELPHRSGPASVACRLTNR